jgi:hypothetical protein
MNPAATAILPLFCGPGLSGCSHSADTVPRPAPAWAREAPGVLRLAGTHFTVTYDPVTDTYQVHLDGHTGYVKSESTKEDACNDAYVIAGKMRDMGDEP